MAGLFDRFPLGYSQVEHDGRRWGVTVRRSDDGRRRSITAVDLAGTEVVGANLYTTSSGVELLRPCEVPAADVEQLLEHARVVPERRDERSRYRRVLQRPTLRHPLLWLRHRRVLRELRHRGLPPDPTRPDEPLTGG